MSEYLTTKTAKRNHHGPIMNCSLADANFSVKSKRNIIVWSILLKMAKELGKLNKRHLHETENKVEEARSKTQD